MPKFSVGDIAIVTRCSENTVIVQVTAWRGGGVAPYICKVLESDYYFYKPGDTVYMPGRDMELREMQGKKKIYCCVPNCSTYSFESKGTIQWQCDKHCPTAFVESCDVTLEQKVDLILEHLGLEVTTEPQKVVLTEVKKGIETQE